MKWWEEVLVNIMSSLFILALILLLARLSLWAGVGIWNIVKGLV